MSPAVLIFLPLTLLLLMSKGAGTQPVKPTRSTSGKVMGILTEDGGFIPLASSADHSDMDTNGVVVEQNGTRYLVASVNK